MKPVASVIIPNWNGRQWLDRCLRSLLAQTLQPIEVLVVDNGSTDGSAEWLAEAFPAVRVLRQTENLGFARATNIGIRASGGKFIVLFNNDAWAEPDWLERCVKVMGDDAAIASVACRTLDYDDPARIYSLGDGFLPNGDAVNIARGMRYRPDLPMPRQVFGPSGCTAVYRRAALEEVGLLDEDYVSFHEDVDLNWRLLLAGYKCLYVPEAVAYHVGYATGRKVNDAVAFLSGRNRLLVLFKNLPWSLWLRFAVPLALRQAQMLWWAIKGNAEMRVRCRGALAALRYLPREWRKRRAASRLRRLGAADVAALIHAHKRLQQQLKAMAEKL
jgi:GT2 family glycosyltransferase